MKMRFQPSTLLLFLLWETEVRCAVQTGSDSKRMLRHSSSKERQLEEPVLQIVGDTGFFGYGKGFSIYPLEQCMGDCDDDDDCAEGLVCFVRQPYKSVPGCQDVGLSYASDVDFCVNEALLAPPQNFTIEVVQFEDEEEETSDNSNSTDTNSTSTDREELQLGQCQGICRDDSDCRGDLICYTSKGGEDIPFCEFDEFDSPTLSVGRQADPFVLQLGFCTLPQARPAQPTPAPTWATLPPGNEPVLATYGDEPTNTTFLQRCEGNCIDDYSCDGDMICYDRRAGDAVPGCFFNDTSANGISNDSDAKVCIERTSLLETNLRLRMYWEEGYYWQEDVGETWWCMRHDSGKAEISRCDSRKSEQVMRLIMLPDGQAMIKSVELGKCIRNSRSGGQARFTTCNQEDPQQLFIAQNGGWNSRHFEITKIGEEDDCLTQLHHPRNGEEIEMYDCLDERRHTTSAWELYW